MNEIKISIKDLNKPIPICRGRTTIIIEKSISKACRLRLRGMLFDTNKSFLLPPSFNGIRQIKKQYEKGSWKEILIVGHADKCGDDQYNSQLSLERADSIHAFLKDDVDMWLHWYDADKPYNKRWGTIEDQHMLSALLCNNNPYYTGSIDGIAGTLTVSALKSFQEDHGLKITGTTDSTTRCELIKQYMNADETTLPQSVSVTTHGCGEFFPEDDPAIGASEDKDQLQKDRRVDIFFFADRISPPPPGKYSSRNSTEYPAWKTLATEVIDVSIDSPEQDEGELWLRCHDAGNNLITDGFCRVSLGSDVIGTVTIDAGGWAKVSLPSNSCYTTIVAEWGSKSGSGPFSFKQNIYVDCSDGDETELSKKRLNNLGYDIEEFEFAVKHFQTNYLITNDKGEPEIGLTASAKLPEFTLKKLNQIFESDDCIVASTK
ncbi:MAG TPA: peptidoglycan-binding protein [Chitinispirillaceae bacterium]|nr:peptidoglycan-binding protein [Chitinispirillaceae bacterium]